MGDRSDPVGLKDSEKEREREREAERVKRELDQAEGHFG